MRTVSSKKKDAADAASFQKPARDYVPTLVLKLARSCCGAGRTTLRIPACQPEAALTTKAQAWLSTAWRQSFSSKTFPLFEEKSRNGFAALRFPGAALSSSSVPVMVDPLEHSVPAVAHADTRQVSPPVVEPIWNWKLVNPAAIKLDKSS